MGRPNRSVSPASAMDHIYNEAVGEAKVVVSANATNLFGFLVENNGAAAVFIRTSYTEFLHLVTLARMLKISQLTTLIKV